MKNKTQLLPLTGIRFFLALWVVVFHQPFFQNPLPALLRSGYLAVGIFFVLSGFVLAYNYSLFEPWSLTNLSQFAVARFARIYPAYFLALLCLVPFADPRNEAGTALLNLTLLQAWVPRAVGSWNGPGWSLSAEAFFYLCFPFIGVAIWRFSRPATMFLLLWILAIAGPLLLSGRITLNAIAYDPLFHLPQFCFGILCARAWLLMRSRNMLAGRGYLLYLPGILLEILGILLCQSLQLNWVLLNNGLLLPLHALIVLGFSAGGGRLAQFLSWKPLVFLGNASYSMYIFHFPISAWMAFCARRWNHAMLDGYGPTAIYIALDIVLASAVYKFIEEPANRTLRKIWSERKTLAVEVRG
jgi:peptidoglycan/LPS O-acetylase OafA/YrhL